MEGIEKQWKAGSEAVEATVKTQEEAQALLDAFRFKHQNGDFSGGAKQPALVDSQDLPLRAVRKLMPDGTFHSENFAHELYIREL